MKKLFRLILAAVLAFLLAPGSVQAGPVWSLQWQFGTNVLISNSGNSLITFTSHNTTSSSSSTNALVASVGESSYEPPNKLDTITHQNYGILLKLTDLASHATHYIWFAGYLTGTLSQHSSTLANHYVTPSSYANIRLGNDVYRISLDPFTTPSWANHFNGSLYVHVSYQPVPTHPNSMAQVAAVAGPMGMMGSMTNPPGGAVNPTPEPSSLILGAMGLGLGMVPIWRRRRRLAA